MELKYEIGLTLGGITFWSMAMILLSIKNTMYQNYKFNSFQPLLFSLVIPFAVLPAYYLDKVEINNEMIIQRTGPWLFSPREEKVIHFNSTELVEIINEEQPFGKKTITVNAWRITTKSGKKYQFSNNDLWHGKNRQIIVDELRRRQITVIDKTN